MAVTLKTFFFFALILIYLASGISSENPCDGDWEPYKDEKCLKIFEDPGLLDYSNAENFCKEQNDSYLLTIDAEEKQKFVEAFLKSHTVFDNLWIGLKYVNNDYQWADGTQSQYTNWANGSPKNDTEYCVQIRTESDGFGLWSDEPCPRKNLVVCEKMQLWSLNQLQTTVMNLIRNTVVPIGFIYVQLPKEKAPEETWPGMQWVWEDISTEYAGLFFRTEGGNAASFGEIQSADSPRLVSMIALVSSDYSGIVSVQPNNEYSEMLDIHGSNDHTDVGFAVKVSNAEVRPVNMAIRIWKRIA